ncbi:MAG: 50S ribosomal protein L18 [Deltaproteobacteria bacterium RIFCSPLOWO2_02_FULL_53_8]|nr:MAG: 50S ribosomal protein L18 [Deltaproteobacteria bacterium RIFCSPLOWO2_02_FULL_53_8]
MADRIEKTTGLERRKIRVRKKVTGTAERPRLNVFRSNKHIYAQVIDDTKGMTLASASTKAKELAGKAAELNKVDVAKKVGEAVAKIALGKGIDKVVFDRGGNIYHGRIKSLADGAREAGLKF